MSNQPLPRPEWLHRTSEAAIEPGRPICDPHHHLWDRPNDRYLAEDFAADLQSGHNIVSTVFIECGARYRPDESEALQPVGASFETWLYHSQLPGLIDLAQVFPETSIVVNHVGGLLGVGPYAEHRPAALADWRDSISSLARCPNVVVKIGGFGMTLFGFGWERRPRPPSSEMLASAIAPFAHYCIDCFGVERAMFESNFPMDKVSCSYGVLWNAFERIAARYSSAEQDALFHDNAMRFYRLDAPA